MKKWIDQLFGRTEEMPCIHSAEKERIRVEVRESRRDCGHPFHLVEVFLLKERDLGGELEPSSIGLFVWEDIQTVIELMQNASDVIAGRVGTRPLPTVSLRGKTYFVDERLSELRDVNDPNKRLEIRG